MAKKAEIKKKSVKASGKKDVKTPAKKAAAAPAKKAAPAMGKPAKKTALVKACSFILSRFCFFRVLWS